MSGIEELGGTIHDANLTMHDTWRHESNEAVRITDQGVRRRLESLGYRMDEEVSSELHWRFDMEHGGYGHVALHNELASEELEKGLRDLQSLLEGTDNEHARRGLQEFKAALKASQQISERLQAIGETILLELSMTLPELLAAIDDAAAKQIYVPFTPNEQLGSIVDATRVKVGGNSDEPGANCNQINRLLDPAFEAIEKYRTQTLGWGDAE